MEFDKFLPLFLTAIVTVLGWFILHRLNKLKERDTKRKELIISFLIDAWEKLEYASHREDYDRVEYLEKPIAKIQMFGNKEQIELAQIFATDISTKQQASLTNLLVSLRKHLRKELKIEEVEDTIQHLRFNKDRIVLHSSICPQCNMRLPAGANACTCGYYKVEEKFYLRPAAEINDENGPSPTFSKDK